MNNGRDSHPESRISELRQQSSQVRDRLEEDVDHLKERAQDLLDWRYQVQKHPWVAVGAAFALGVWLVPRRTTRVTQAVPSELPCEPRDDESPSLLKLAGRSLLISGLTLISRNLLESAGQYAHSKYMTSREKVENEDLPMEH